MTKKEIIANMKQLLAEYLKEADKLEQEKGMNEELEEQFQNMKKASEEPASTLGNGETEETSQVEENNNQEDNQDVFENVVTPEFQAELDEVFSDDDDNDDEEEENQKEQENQTNQNEQEIDDDKLEVASELFTLASKIASRSKPLNQKHTKFIAKVLAKSAEKLSK